ncbi:MAG: primosomal protein N' [Firmicutes bacterium]|nr:primosomal protein N' [Bacillota bacterium]
MNFVEVYIEHNTLALNQTFTYACSQNIQVGCRVKVSFGNKECIGFVQSIHSQSELKNIKEVIEVLDQEPLLNEELMQLADYMSHYYVASQISCLKMMLPPALRPQSDRASIIYEDVVYKNNVSIELTKRQQEIVDTISFPILASEFRKIAKSVAKTLLEKGVVRLEKQEKHRQLVESSTDKKVVLKPEQINAIQTIQNGKESVYLLHGVTGSGKTEVFLQLAQSVLNEGKQVLFLVPEIGLTPMMIQRVCARFGQNIAIFHSRLSDQEKYDQYQLVKNNEVNIVVGTRSAVFMPFSNLGLILMDEEHDNSYKQDQMPRYHTRDIALRRAAYHHCKCVLASATPSLESYARAYKNVYKLVTLSNRINETMPDIHIVNLQTEHSHFGISDSLKRAMEDRFEKNEQVLLLLNRRGYLPILRCQECHEIMTCPDCGIALSYHKSTNSCVCHICGNSYPFLNTCPNCKSHSFFQTGMGTEKLEEQIQTMFPHQKIIRMDQDSTRKKNAHKKLLETFENEGDILLGTQMITKGLDFERVTCVGILNADSALVRQDYRSSESAYQILEQASGRSGRGNKKGEVFIQTYQPEHFVIESVKEHNYLRFFNQEMKYRHLGWYPPYSYLCSLVFSSNKVEETIKVSSDAKEFFKEFKVLGPVEISMRNKQKRYRILLKSNNLEYLNKSVEAYSAMYNKLHRNVKMEINMHPMYVEE